MENKKYYKNLAKELLERIGHEPTSTRLKRIKYLMAAYDVLEAEPDAQLILIGKCFMSIKGKNKINIRNIKAEQLHSAN